MPQHNCCLKNCLKTRKYNTILHLFPNPEKELQRFNEWAKVIKGDILYLDPKKVYEQYRVCHDHFETKYHTRSSRLSANAVPTLILLDEVKVEDVKEIVQETASLSNDELKELADQEEHTNIGGSDSEEDQKELSTAFLKTSLNTITEIMDQFIANDLNSDRSSKARRGVMNALSTYQQILTGRKKKRK